MPFASNIASRRASLSIKGSCNPVATADPTVVLPLAGSPVTTKNRGICDLRSSPQRPSLPYPEAVSHDRQLVADKSLRRPQARQDEMSPMINPGRPTAVHSIPAPPAADRRAAAADSEPSFILNDRLARKRPSAASTSANYARLQRG